MRPVGRSVSRGVFVSAALILGACGSIDRVPPTTSGNPDAADPQKPQYGYKVGRTYRIRGRWYTPREDFSYDVTGIASWYGTKFHGRKTANGEIYDMNKMTAAHPTLPLPSLVEVTNLKNGRTVQLRVNDRGPFAHDRIIDVSRRAAERLGFKRDGVTRVRVRVVREQSLRMKYIGLAAKGHKVPAQYLAARPQPTLSPVPAAAPRQTPTTAPVTTPSAISPGPARAANPLTPAGRPPVKSEDLPPLEPRRTTPPAPGRQALGVAPTPQQASPRPNTPSAALPTTPPPAGAPRNLIPDSWNTDDSTVAGRIKPSAPVSGRKIAPATSANATPNATPNAAPKVALAPVPNRSPAVRPSAGRTPRATPAAPAKSPAHSAGNIYVQAGAYSKKYNADRVRRELSRIGRVQVTTGHFNNVPFYRVRVGPVTSRGEGDQLLAKVVGRGYPGARIVVD